MSTESWANTFPELKTRPELLSELLVNRRLRRKLFHAFNVLEQVSHCPEPNVATEALQVIADYHWKRLQSIFQSELESKDGRIYNELVSTYRNFVLNMRFRNKPESKKRRVKNQHFVRRAA